MAKTKMRAPAKVRKSHKTSASAAETRERNTADKVMETVLAESQKEATTERLDQWVNIECPHCGESTDLHVIADMDGQSIDQDCAVCCRTYVAHVDIEEGEANVSVEGA